MTSQFVARGLTVVTAVCFAAVPVVSGAGAEFHVSVSGNDSNDGTKAAPFRTIQKAADAAEPGDVITVHAGTFRERVAPPRGGTSDKKRITYQAAPGERVEIKGSELAKGWKKIQENVWELTLPSSFFGAFNPYKDEIHGDWFNGKGRVHHTGAVYLNGEWLIEAAKFDEVISPGQTPPAWLGQSGQYLLNIAWLRPEAGDVARTSANAFAAQQGIQTAPCSEGGECIGFIEAGDWVRYDSVDFGQETRRVQIRAASATQGGVVEIRLQDPKGELLGSCSVPNTGGWQSWSSFNANIKPTSGKQNICLVFKPQKIGKADVAMANTGMWFSKVEDSRTIIWAQFRGVDPNHEEVEINVRRTVFYPEKTGCNYITVRGFTMKHAATPWAPPTAEQIGLIGTHWSRGWIIEDNVVSHSICSGIALGKYGDQWDNTSANTAEGYVKTIERALENGWNSDSIGHHIVRNNSISHCEQAGIVGSLGAAFCEVTGNTIHDIHSRRLFTGAEMAGIKFHAAIDTEIKENHIYRTVLGLWLDWMAQGTRVSANLFHDNDRDMFVEVNHGPFVADNNLFLSDYNLLDISEGGAFIHNLFNGRINGSPEPRRETPYHPPHSTTVAGLTTIKGGDCRYYNNIFIGRGRIAGPEVSGFGLSGYDGRDYPLYTGGNVYYNGALPYTNENGGVEIPDNPKLKLTREDGRAVLHLELGKGLKSANEAFVTTELLGRAKVTGLPYENADGSFLKITTDFNGKKRSTKEPTTGPFENPSERIELRTWAEP